MTGVLFGALAFCVFFGFWLALRWLLGRLLPDDTEWVEEAQQGISSPDGER